MEKQASFKSDATGDDVREFYQKWSKSYDEEIHANANWPCAPTLVKAFISAIGDGNKDTRILDLGAGTGMLASELKEFGFTNIDALDASKEMLEKAQEKELYKKYMCEYVTAKKLNIIPTGSYDAIISCGTITGGYVKYDAFDEILRLVKQGGHICFTVRKDVYDQAEYGYAKKFNEFVESDKWQITHKKVGDYSLTGKENQKKCYIICAVKC